jgi:hypothetical protein
MNYDLKNLNGDTHTWNASSWWYLLNIAFRYGWQPLGTEPAASTNRSGYFKQTGETVHAADAAALAGALEGFYNDVCRDEIAGEVAERMQEVIGAASGTTHSQQFDIFIEPVEAVRKIMNASGDHLIPVWNFSEHSNERLRQFIAFCRKGSFTIE